MLGTVGGRGRACAACSILREALLLSKDDLNVQAEFHATLSLIDDDDVTGKLEHAEAALASFRRLTDPDPWLWSHVAEAVMDAEFRAGRGVRMDLIEKALAAERSAVGPNYRARASLVLQIALGQRSEEHTSELQSRGHLVFRLLLEKK